AGCGSACQTRFAQRASECDSVSGTTSNMPPAHDAIGVYDEDCRLAVDTEVARDLIIVDYWERERVVDKGEIAPDAFSTQLHESRASGARKIRHESIVQLDVLGRCGIP